MAGTFERTRREAPRSAIDMNSLDVVHGFAGGFEPWPGMQRMLSAKRLIGLA